MRYVLVPAEKGVKSIEIDVPDEIVKRSIKTKMTCKPIFVKKKFVICLYMDHIIIV